ncbi:DUF892 family protein [Mucilaginibacter robiniae]|uniref:DUF892 family protein n=1 Tax=Mucilaginibacter robiniae TaxID=2728022 RepID=A0A7L5E0Q7_9SPHI|nr:DUF892 family protein [Mucilaginibacter robiniae]QJD96815.1 DUF892 family protein [Mucilaginibacter robiniae]
MSTIHDSDNVNLTSFFVHHINRLYFAKEHLLNKVPELQRISNFKKLNLVLDEMVEDLQQQLNRIELMLNLLDKNLDFEAARSMNNVVDCAYHDIRTGSDNQPTDLSLLYYLEIMEGIEMSCFKMLRMAAVKIGNRQVNQLLRENYDDAKDMRTLLLLIATELIAK